MKKNKRNRATKADAPQPESRHPQLIEALRKVIQPGVTPISPVIKNGLISLLLVLLLAGVVAYKLNLLDGLSYFDPRDGQGFFWTESAFHYRHFLMIAGGEPIPALDTAIQHPEGLNTVRYITPVMEHVAGYLYRLMFTTMPPHLFAAYFSIIFSTLSVLAIFLAGKIAWRSYTVAFLCAVIYGFALASVARSAGGGFIREDFALPFIFSSFACFLSCLQQDRPLVAVAGSLLLVAALLAWHVTQLYLSVFVAALAVAYLVDREKGLPPLSMLVFVGFMVAASLVIPVLRAKYFIFSPAMMVSMALLGLSWTKMPRDRHGIAGATVSALTILVCLCASLMIQGYLGTYSHVYSLLAYKLKYLGTLPQDPGSLPFEAKSMWTSAFVSPKLIELPAMLAASLVFGPIGTLIIANRIRRREFCGYEFLIGVMAIWMFLFFLLIHRMSVFAVFFLALSVGALIRIKRVRLRFSLFAALGVALVIQFILLPAFGLHAFRPNQRDVNDLLSFVRSHTEPEAPVLSTFELGPSIAAYTGRPVALHSKFESKLLRDKVRRTYTALYQSEAHFFELCRRLDVDYFVYQVNMLLSRAPGSIRYLTHSDPLEADSAVFKFHFQPDQLTHFNLVYQNPTYRVFQVITSRISTALTVDYEPIYDLTVFTEDTPVEDAVDDRFVRKGLQKLENPQIHLTIADRFFEAGDYRTAARQYQRVLVLDSRNRQAAWSLARALIKSGETEKSKPILAAAVALDPDYNAASLAISDASALNFLANEALSRKQFAKAIILFENVLEQSPGSEAANLGLGTAWRARNNLDAAQSAFQSVIAINPENYKAHENLAKIHAIRGQLQEAVASIEASLKLKPSQPDLEDIYRQLQKRLAARKTADADFEHYFRSGLQKAQSGDLQSAISLFLKASEFKKTGSLMYNLGLVSHQLQKDEAALVYLEESLAINPSDIKARSLLRYIQHQQMNVVRIGAESQNAQHRN